MCSTEVARTRLREEGTKYRSFFQTLFTVYSEEGPRGLYRGLTTQLVRQIPNTAIMMATYEAAVYLMTAYYCPNEAVFYEDSDDRYEWYIYIDRNDKLWWVFVFRIECVFCLRGLVAISYFDQSAPIYCQPYLSCTYYCAMCTIF